MRTKHHPNDISPEELRSLKGRIARLPDALPPPGLVDAVMSRVQPKQRPVWRNWLRRMRSPWAVMILRPVPAALFMLLLAGGAVLSFKAYQGGFYSSSSDRSALKPIIFILEWPTARKVAVIGSFNQWNAEGYQMQRDTPDAPWRLKLELSHGSYAYAFLIDDQWLVPDPHALLYQNDGFGNLNSALIVENGKSDADQM